MRRRHSMTDTDSLAKYIALIRNELQRQDAKTFADRQAVYARVREIAGNRRATLQEFDRHVEIGLTIEHAISAVEKEAAAKADGWFERVLHYLFSTAAGLKSRYGALAAVVATVADFFKPIVALSWPIVIGSAVLGLALYALRSRAGAYRHTVQTAATFCAGLFLTGLAYVGLQSAIPGADATGAFVRVVPGASAAQNAILASLGRLETETKRIGDILDEGAKRERDQAAQNERAQQAHVEGLKTRISEAGYSLDAKGLLQAVIDGSRLAFVEFALLKIALTEDVIRDALPQLNDRNQAGRVLNYLASHKDENSAARRIHAALAADRKKISDAFENSRAREVLCDVKTYSYVIGEAALREICEQTGLRFAVKFAQYFALTYGYIRTDDSDAEQVMRDPRNFMRKSPSELPIAARDLRIVFSQLQECQYYQGELEYFFQPGLNPWGSFQRPNSVDISFFDVLASDFGHGAEQTCTMTDVVARRRPQCRAQVIFASRCEAMRQAVIKPVTNVQIAAAAAPSQRGVAPGAEPPARPNGDGLLGPDDVRRTLVGRNVDHSGTMMFRYQNNGTFEAADGRRASGGRYRIEQDGRLCWQNSLGSSGCFQYYRRGGALHVRRNDASSRAELGKVTVTAR
jgi:hypothetical protein